MLQDLLEPPVEDVADRSVRARVLNATNGSAASASATAAAAVIARERDAELIVVHVCAAKVMRVGRLAPTIVHEQRLRDPHANGVLSAGARPSRTPAVVAGRTRYRIRRGSPCPVRVVVLAAPTRGGSSLRSRSRDVSASAWVRAG